MIVTKNLLSRILGISLIMGAVSVSSVGINTTHADSMSGAPGTWSGKPNTIDLSPSMTGDMLFGYNNGCVYGNWFHVALVTRGSTYSNGVWDGPTIESTVTGDANKSVRTTTKQSRFRKYDKASLDKFSKSGYKFESAKIVENANSYQGPYNVLAKYTTDAEWYCAKLVSRAFYDYNGYKLGFFVLGSLISPKDIYYDSAVIERTFSKSAGYIEPRPGFAKASSFTKKKINYKGYTINTKEFNIAEKNIVDQLIKQEKNGGKGNLSNKKITLSDSKEGLNEYLKDLLDNNLATKEQIQEKWNLSNSEVVALQ